METYDNGPGGWEIILVFLLIFALPAFFYWLGYNNGKKKQKLISEIENLKQSKE